MAQSTSSKPIIALIPWDPQSSAHVERLTEQRKACGWSAELVAAEWKDAYVSGEKCLYWLTFFEDETKGETYTKLHVNAYPKETTELLDTSSTLLCQPRTPTMATFLPIGHIAFDAHTPSFSNKLGLVTPDSGLYWIKSLYVSYVLQGHGIGGAAMKIAEQIVSQEPLRARHLLLDTVHHEDQQDRGFAKAFYGDQLKVPTQPWYERQGYRLFATMENYYQVPDSTGKIWPTRTVFLRKDIGGKEECAGS